MNSESAKNKIWDYVIVGTGMGGGPIGLKLAQAGFSVLFLEKGLSPTASDSLKGQFAELHAHVSTQDATEVLKKAGRWNVGISDRSTFKAKKLLPFMGSGVGGSSALYGAVLERFKPSDLQSWPIPASVLHDYYDQAEKLFRVRKPTEFRHPQNEILKEHLLKQGLHPYQLPLANEDQQGCNVCQSYLCAKGCKNDAGRICIEQAVQSHGASLLTNCSVQRIQMKGRRGVSVLASLGDEQVTIQAQEIILSAGALMSPVILQQSGIGNKSNLLGRNLMRHYVDLYALKIPRVEDQGPTKELGFNDFYTDQGENFGTVQSFGSLPPVSVILAQMQRDLISSYGKVMGFLFSFIKPLMRQILAKVTDNRLVMTSILEDSPQFENRVWSENGQICISYKISKQDRNKIRMMRSKVKAAFKSYQILFIKAAEKNEMLAHVCGTCKMGTDPKTSVVDVENKLHGYENIYVVDSSFFPTSGGTNPALTIAANSLRVADLLIAKAKKKRSTVESSAQEVSTSPRPV